MDDMKVVFKKPFNFEGKEYKEIDLSNIESLATKDLIESDKIFNNSGQVALMNEMATGYTCILASKATNLPIEFFENLPAKEGLKVKNKVMGFLNA
jgi:hypothetical protein